MPRNSHSPKQAPDTGGGSRTAASSPQQDFWSGQARHQMERGLQALDTLLHAGEEIGQLQLQAARQALERQKDLQRQLQQAEDLPQLLQLQAEFWRFAPASAARYWHGLFDATLRLNGQLMRGQMDLLNSQPGDAVKTALETVQSTLTSGARPPNGFFGMPGPQDYTSHAGRTH